MDFVAVAVLRVLAGVAVLALLAIGLAVIFGAMRVINLAHGEFLMLGGYAAILAEARGVDLWIAMFVVAPLAVGAVGLAAERLLIRRLYGRMTDTLLATWGLGLLLSGAVAMAFGGSARGVSAPLGAFAIGEFTVSAYDPVLIAAAVGIYAGVYFALRRTRAGLYARAAMQDADLAAAHGVDPARVRAAMFAAGAALSGLAGALLAPVSGVAPSIGLAYIAKAFVTVIAGGMAVVGGAAPASALLGTVGAAAEFAAGPVMGEVALLAAAILVVRLLPRGIAGRFSRSGS